MATQPRINGQPSMGVTQAREHVKSSMRQLAAAWSRQTPFVRQTQNAIVLMDTLKLERQRNGTVRVYTLNDVETWEEVQDFPVHVHYGNRYEQIIARRLEVLAAAELRRLTARDFKVEHLRHMKRALEKAAYGLSHFRKQDGSAISYYWLAREMHGEVERFLNTNVIEIARRVAGNRVWSMADYNFVAPRMRTLGRLRQENEALLPFVVRLAKAGKIRLGRYAYQHTKQHLLAQGMSKGAWRVLYQWGAAAVDLLLCGPNNVLVQEAERFSRIGIVPCESHLTQSYQMRARSWMRVEIPDWFERAAWAAARSLPENEARDFFVNSYRHALDWLQAYRANGGIPDKNQQKAGWMWIERQSEAWHEETVRRQVTHNLTWSCILKEYEDEEAKVLVLPLLSSESLAIEGARMHHCVGSYAARCHAGHSRIFSLRREGKSLATVELVRDYRDASRWVINQNKAPCNGVPGKALQEAAERLVQKYSERERALNKQAAEK